MSKALLFLFVFLSFVGFAQNERPYFQKALEAEKWLRSVRTETNEGVYWPKTPGNRMVEFNLYSGTSGIVLFYLELYGNTKNEEYLKEAEKGTDYIISRFQSKPGYDEVGFYTGTAGLFWTVNKVYEITRKKKYQLAAQLLFQSLEDKAKRKGNEVSWRYNDIVYGSAGIGLALMDTPQISGASKFALATGNGLLSTALHDPTGKKWYMDTAMMKQNYYMPNFSHGTAGVCYFLSRLYQKTGQKEFLDDALQGAAHLESLENSDKWIFHHDVGEGKDLFYLSWCHGPAGTARLYYQLYKITRDEKWLNKMEVAASALMQCGIPEKELPGFWNNVGPCCGSAGVAEFFLDLFIVTHEQSYLDFSKQVTENLMEQATVDDYGIKWIQAENRKSPEQLEAQTGLMQGAAGIGLWLLHLDEYESGRPFTISLPDNPF